MSIIKRGTDFPSIVDELFDSGISMPSVFNTASWFNNQNMPKVNISEQDKAFTIELSAPGLTKNDFQINVDNGFLTISCEKEEEQNDKKYKVKEYSYHKFSRSFSLPENINEDDIKAKYEGGVLSLTVPKKETSQQKPKKAIRVS